MVLKLVCTEAEMFEEMFAILMPEGTEDEMKQVQTCVSSGGCVCCS